MNLERAQSIISAFTDQRILVVGDVVLDHYIFGKVERLNPEAPVPVLLAQRESERTGGAGNTAKNTASLGATTTLISVTGADNFADNIERAAIREHYHPRFIQDPSRPTIRKSRHIVDSQQLLRVDWEQTQDISSGIEGQVIVAIEEEVKAGVHAIIVSDYAKGVITRRVANAIMQLAKANNLIVAADVKPSRAQYFIGASLISPNLKEAHEYLGYSQFNTGDHVPKELAQDLNNKMQTDVFLTLGADGIYVSSIDKITGHVPQQHVREVFDVSGAGDTAIATLTLARVSGADPMEAAHLANAACAVVVGKVGTVGVTTDELRHVTHPQTFAMPPQRSRQSSPGQPVIFLDRDGTINVDNGYVHQIDQWQFTPHAPQALQALQKAGYTLAIVTNQSGVAQRKYRESDVHKIHQHMTRLLKMSGVNIAAIAYCIHGRDDNCNCRKPAPGMAEQIEKKIGKIDYANSWMIGDKEADLKFGSNIGARTALIKSKYTNGMRLSTKPDLTVNSLHEFSKEIIKQHVKV